MPARTLRDYISAAVVQAPPGQPFTLASGRRSSYYVDLRKALLVDGRAMDLAARALYGKLPGEVESIGGIPTAGLLLLGPLLVECERSDAAERPRRKGFYTRTEAKAHGTGARVEGHPTGVACLVEDTVSTGKSIVEHAAIAREAGVDVRYALALLDREQGGAENLLRNGITLLACLRSSEVV